MGLEESGNIVLWLQLSLSVVSDDPGTPWRLVRLRILVGDALRGERTQEKGKISLLMLHCFSPRTPHAGT